MADKKMTQAQVLAKAKENIYDLFKEIIERSQGEQVADFAFAIPTQVNDMEKWVRIEFTAKTTMTTDDGKIPYDPFIEQENWKADKEIKQAQADERARKKAETLKKVAERKEKAEAQALAKKNAREKALAEIEKSE